MVKSRVFVIVLKIKNAKRNEHFLGCICNIRSDRNAWVRHIRIPFLRMLSKCTLALSITSGNNNSIEMMLTGMTFVSNYRAKIHISENVFEMCFYIFYFSRQ